MKEQSGIVTTKSKLNLLELFQVSRHYWFVLPEIFPDLKPTCTVQYCADDVTHRTFPEI